MNKNLLFIIFIIILVIVMGGAYLILNTLKSTEQNTSLVSENNQTNSNQNQSQVYDGQFYTFSYPKDWDAWEANLILGLTILYPKTKVEQVMNKTISTTDEITLAIVDGQINMTGTQKVTINGQSWFIETSDKPFDGGTENGIEYLKAMTTNKYIAISTGISNKGILEMVAESFNSKLK